MAKIERLNKERMDKHSRELEHKEMKMREDKAKSEAKHKEKIIKKDAHWEAFPKAREKERKAKLYRARNAVFRSHKEGEAKQKSQCEKVQKEEDKAQVALEAEKQMQKKIQAKTEQLVKARFEPKMKEHDTKEKDSKAKTRREHEAKRAEASLATLKTQEGDTKKSELSSKVALR